MPLVASLLLACGLGTADPDAVRVRLDLARGAAGRPVLTVHAEYPSGNFEVSTLEVETDAGGPPETDPRLVVARDLVGRRLEVEPDGRGRWHVHHPLGERFRVELRLAASPTTQRPDTAELYGVVLNERMLHTAARGVLPMPEGVDRKRARAVRFEWTGHDSLGWDAACSLGGGAGPFEARLSLDDLYNALFLAGEFELFDYEVPGGRLLVATAGEAWGSDRIEFAELARDALAFERSYFRNSTTPFHLISLLPIDEPRVFGPAGSGVALHRACVLAVESGVAFSGPYSRRREVGEVLLHEVYHGLSAELWDFRASARPHWFIEGFAEFYARRLALRAGWTHLPDYLANLNRVLADYARSPARDASARRVAAEFSRNPTLRRQPYLLGDLIALRVDAAMLAHSRGERGLDEFMRSLIQEANADPRGRLTLRSDELLARMEDWCGGPLEDVRRSALDGAPFELPADVLAPAIRLDTVAPPHGPRYQRASVVPAQRAAAFGRL